MSSSATEEPVRSRFLTMLKDRVEEDHWDPWFVDVQIFEEADVFLVQSPSTLHSTFIQQRYKGLLAELAAHFDRDGATRKVVYCIAEQQLKTMPDKVSNHTSNPRLLNQNLTFDGFVTGPSNQLAHAAAMAVAENPGSSYNPFFLHGSVGLGKTHLLQAVAHRMRERGIENVVTISCASFTNDFISALSSRKIDEFRKRYREAGALLIDDIQFLCDKERTQEEFFHTFNEIYNQEQQIFLTSDAPPSEIEGLSERLVSRFRLGLVVQMSPPDLETRMAILQQKATARGLDLPFDVIEMTAHQIRDNIRELEGAVLRIESMIRHEGKDPNTANAAIVLTELRGDHSTRIDLRRIEELVCEEFAVTPGELHSPKRTRSIVLPRQVCMYLGRRHTDCSLGEIGQYFGGRDHSTVLHSIEKIRNLFPMDAGLRRSIEQIKEKLRLA